MFRAVDHRDRGVRIVRPAVVLSIFRRRPPIMVFRGQKLSVTVTEVAPFAFGRASTLFKASAEGLGDVCVKLFPQVKGGEWESVALFEREVTGARG